MDHIPCSTSLSGHSSVLQCDFPRNLFEIPVSLKGTQRGVERPPLNSHLGITWVLETHRVRWLNPTVLNVNALAKSRTWVKITPIASSNSVSFCRTGEVSISCRSVFGSCSYRKIEIKNNMQPLIIRLIINSRAAFYKILSPRGRNFWNANKTWKLLSHVLEWQTNLIFKEGSSNIFQSSIKFQGQVLYTESSKSLVLY